MIPERITSHEDAAAELLTDRFRGKLVIDGVVRALAKQKDGEESIIWDVLEGRTLDDAEGVWLDFLGKIAGELRRGRSDTDYRYAIRVRIRVNRSKGRAVDVIDVARLLSSTATYLEYYPLAWEVEIYGTTNGGDFSVLLGQTKAITSYGVLLTSTLAEADVFQWDYSGASLGAGHLWESSHV